MKKCNIYSVLLAVIGISYLCSGYIFSKRELHGVISSQLFDNSGAPTTAVREIFEYIGNPVTSLEQANDFAQKNFLRIGERWDAQEQKEWHALAENNKALILGDFKSLGMVDEVTPKHGAYKYVLLMGATKATVMSRLDYLAELKKQGLRFEVIVLLGGARQLQDVEKEGLPLEVTTEAEMMTYVFQHHAGFSNDQVLLVDAPMIQREDGTLTRPTTDSTLVHFEKIAPEGGSCLVISNNPYILRQTKVAQRILDQKRFPTEGVGKGLSIEAVNMVILFDELARTIYEEFKSRQSK